MTRSNPDLALFKALVAAQREQSISVAAQGKENAGGSITWVHLAILLAVFGSLFWINLQRLWQWTNPSSGDPNWGHAIFIPLISLAYLLEHRDRVMRTPIRPASIGLAIVAGGIALFVCGIGIGTNFVEFGPYVQDVAMLTTLFGCVVSLFGWPMVRVALFPMAYLLCALPWPPYIHDLITFPLQKLAASASVRVLQLTGMNVEQAGNTIHILAASGVDRALNVAEACSGMRSLITFIAIGLAVAFLSPRPWWQKLIISLSAVPIAVVCNIFRIVGEAVLDQHVSRSLSEGFAHSAVGVVLLLPGFGLFLLVGRVLDLFTVQRRTSSVAAKNVKSAPVNTRSPVGAISMRKMYAYVLCILLMASAGLAASSRFLHLYFVKVPVPLVRPLTELSSRLGPWRQWGGNQAISSDLQQTLGTPHYVFREYVDERLLDDQGVETLINKSPEASILVHALAEAHPGAIVRLAVTYYTGRVDAVIHQSERCNLADGIATSVDSQPEIWNVADRRLKVRIVHLLKEASQDQGPHYIAYCYFVNGAEESEAWRVRSRLMNIFERHAWYAKIEVTTGLADAHDSQRVLSDFLQYALPEIEKWLPPMQVQTIGASLSDSTPGVERERANGGAK